MRRWREEEEEVEEDLVQHNEIRESLKEEKEGEG